MGHDIVIVDTTLSKNSASDADADSDVYNSDSDDVVDSTYISGNFSGMVNHGIHGYHGHNGATVERMIRLDLQQLKDDADDPSEDDDEVDEDDYGDGDEPEAREASSDEAEFDPYAVAVAAAEQALEEESA